MPLKSGSPIPELEGATEWFNGTVTKDDLAGGIALIYFWALSCHICKENMPVLREWVRDYTPKGVRFVSIHMPRQESDTHIADVKSAIENLGITEPVAIDNDHTIGERFETTGFWPYYFIFDKEGAMRGRAAGHAGLKTIENTLKRLIE